ncbi:hypothetical protein IKW75_03365 [Candidatus Saccharibacteria bacterium]|nr:hypothetical protein [Candidatus Saccharibacteria bacterium]
MECDNIVIEYWRRKPKKYHVVLLYLVGITGAAFLYGQISSNIFNGLRSFLFYTFPSVLEWPFMTKCAYCICSATIFVVTTVWLGHAAAVKVFFKKEIKRNRGYVQELFSSAYYGAAATKRRQLVEDIYGEKIDDAEALQLVSKRIDGNINRVKAFLAEDSHKKENVLGVNSGWGSGKTTTVLIAIDETDNPKNRYVYESVFKYSGNISEFINDILGALESTIDEFGIDTGRHLREIIKNLDTNFARTLLNFMKNPPSLVSLTTESIMEINEAYENKGVENKIFLIIDDLDRLNGEDLVRIFSLLSTLRRFKFLRIIILADYSILVEILRRHNVVEPQKFIEKYLPAQKMLKLDSGYNMATGVVLDKFFYAQDGWNRDHDGALPALAAVLFYLLAKRLRAETATRSNVRFRWLPDGIGDRALPDDLDEVTSQILGIPVIMRKNSGELAENYTWRTYYNNIARLEDVLVALDRRIGETNTKVRVLSNFRVEDYVELIDSWIFGYMQTRWDIFQFTLRDLLDIVSSVDYGNLPKDSAEQFAYVFNQLFPNNEIKVVK